MLTKIMKYVCVAALILAAAFWTNASAYELPLRFAVSLGALLVAFQAVKAQKRGWSIGFSAIAVLFNPVLPLGSFSGVVALTIIAASTVPFALSLFALPTQPLLSIPSITGRVPGRRSL
jgi:Family of unknown function (DUF6804)